MQTERLDKLLARELNLTRSEAKAMIKRGGVTVNGSAAVSGDTKCGDGDSITALGKPIAEKRFVYIMMNKPEGVVCATEDREETTVLDLLPAEMRRRSLFPAGRLDKDTTGFVLLTDNGAFAHEILSPRRHIDKTYLAVLDKPVSEALIRDFQNGMTLGGETLLPAELAPVDDDGKTVQVTLRQGIYHQIKRMFGKYGITVLALRRTAMGSLPLDEMLPAGGCRYLTEEEVKRITL